jgi:adenylate cyclase
MDENAFNALAGWVTEAGLIGRTESELMAGFCRRVADAGVPLTRAIVILDTLHSVYEGRAFRWRADAAEVAEAVDYGRTNEGEAAENWRRSPFFHLLQSGEKVMRRRLAAGDPADFPTIAQARDEGATDVLVFVHRFAAEGVIGEMDCVYSTWFTDAPNGFDEGGVSALKQLAPFLKLAVKSAALARTERRGRDRNFAHYRVRASWHQGSASRPGRPPCCAGNRNDLAVLVLHEHHIRAALCSWLLRKLRSFQRV